MFMFHANSPVSPLEVPVPLVWKGLWKMAEIWALDLSIAYEARNNLISDYMRFLLLSDFQHCRLWCLA